MNIDREQSQALEPVPDWVMICFGYLCAVSVVTLSCLVEFSLEDLLTSAGRASLPVLVIIGQVFWFVAFVTALPPFVVSYVIARRLMIRSIFYYGAWGAATGLMLTPVALWLSPPDDPEYSRTFLQGTMVLAPKFMFVGLCGALTYWSVAGRRLRFARAEAAGAQV